jgi:hypothetical protein
LADVFRLGIITTLYNAEGKKFWQNVRGLLN